MAPRKTLDSLVKLSMTFTQTQVALLSAFAKTEGRSMAYLVREAVNEWIERRTKKGAA